MSEEPLNLLKETVVDDLEQLRISEDQDEMIRKIEGDRSRLSGYRKQTENVQAARQIRFTNVQEIDEMQLIIKTYIDEAIEVEKAGLK